MQKLFWIDLEMTGLDVNKEVIIEAAAIITDLDLNPIVQYHAVVKQPQHFLDSMDDWNRTHHGDSGLTALVPKGKDPAIVEDELIALIDTHFKEERPVLAGNSIAQDRLFIDRHFKKLSNRLHYRMLDVTSWKIVLLNKYKVQFPKSTSHRALDDILESINELKHYLSFIQIPQNQLQEPVSS
ncbi:MAG: oligoribonuclease [Oligoflexia bacterium]|nr:oligoribonuclease [Oligoflexia bacterium]